MTLQLTKAAIPMLVCKKIVIQVRENQAQFVLRIVRIRAVQMSRN